MKTLRRHRRAVERVVRRAPRAAAAAPMKAAPCPSPSLSTSTVPPCSSIRWRTIERPSPRPPWVRVIDPSAWRKRSKTKGRKSGRMPIPVSLTRMTAFPPTSRRRTSTRPPRGVNLMAFDSRFQITCWRRSASPSTGLASGAIETSRRIPLASAAGRTLSSAASMMRRRSTGLKSSRSLPVMMRETSSRSAISCACARALRSIVSSASRARRPGRACRRAAPAPSRGWR